MVLGNLKVGNIQDLLAKRELALVQYQKVLDMKDYKDSHKQARQYIEAPYKK